MLSSVLTRRACSTASPRVLHVSLPRAASYLCTPWRAASSTFAPTSLVDATSASPHVPPDEVGTLFERWEMDAEDFTERQQQPKRRDVSAEDLLCDAVAMDEQRRLLDQPDDVTDVVDSEVAELAAQAAPHDLKDINALNTDLPVDDATSRNSEDAALVADDEDFGEDDDDGPQTSAIFDVKVAATKENPLRPSTPPVTGTDEAELELVGVKLSTSSPPQPPR